MVDRKHSKKPEKPKEVFLPWLIDRKERLFFIFFAIFMLLLLVYQGGAGDLAKAPIWIIRGIAFLAFLFFYLLEYARPGYKNLPLPTNRQKIFRFAFLSLIIFLVINVFTAVSWKLALSESLNFMMIIAVMTLVSIYASTRERIGYVLYILLAVGLIAAIYGLVQYFEGSASAPLDSFFAWHNPAGGYFASILMIFLALVFTQTPSSKAGRLGWTGKIVIEAALLLTLSRGSWLAAILSGILLWMLLGVKRTFNKTSVLIAVLFAVVVISGLSLVGGRSFLTPVYHRVISFSATEDFSMQGRENFYSAAHEMFNDHMVTGSGLGSYGFLYPQYQTDPRFFARDPHSFYLRLMAEGGIFGIALIIVILWSYAHLLVLFFKNHDSSDMALSAGLIAALTAGLLHMAIDFDDTFPFILLNLGVIWVLALNLLDPVIQPAIIITPETEKPRSRGTLASTSILLALLVFLGVYHCSRMYYSESHYDTGMKFTSALMWQDAVNEYDSSLRFYPGNDRAMSELVRALLFLIDSESQSATPEDTPDSENKETLISKVVAVSQKLKESAPYNAKSFFLSGMSLIRSSNKQDHMTAISDFQTALKLDSKNSPRYYLEMVKAYADVGGFSEALKTIGSFKKIFPSQKIDEYTRTRLDWADLPDTWQDILIIEAEIFMINGLNVQAEEMLRQATKIEEIRKSINGDKFVPRTDMVQYIDKLKEKLKNNRVSE
jgi:tetratricopeptide (TPR) repeat protein